MYITRTNKHTSIYTICTKMSDTKTLKVHLTPKMAVFWSYFRDFVRAQKIEDLTESKNFFRRTISNNKEIRFTKKNLWG